MTLLETESVALGAAAFGWCLAVRAARRRRVLLGPAPLPSLAALVLIAAVCPPAGVTGAIVLGGVTAAAIADARTGFVFTPVTLALGLSALCAAVIDGRATTAGTGMLATGGALFALHAVTSGRGIGLGDVRLGCSVGAALGVVPGLIALGWAFVLGGAYGVILLVTRRARPGSEIRFAPFIATATIIVSASTWP